MRGRRYALYFLCMIAAAAQVSCDDTPSAPHPSYPITLTPLPPEDLATLRSEFAAQNPSYCSTLDEYAFTKFSSPCGTRGDVSCTNVDSLLLLATSDLIRNDRFIGLITGEELQIRDYTCGPTSHPSLDIRFEDQVYKGLEVLGTEIIVHMDQSGVRAIDGHHYPEILVPYPLVPPKAAQQSIVGMKITWYDIGGRPRDYFVREDSFAGDPYRVVFPYHVENQIELRVPWAIPIGGWIVYVDSMTGEQIGVRQLFIT